MNLNTVALNHHFFIDFCTNHSYSYLYCELVAIVENGAKQA